MAVNRRRFFTIGASAFLRNIATVPGHATMAWPPFEAALFDERETISMTTKATSAARAVGPTYPIDPSGEGGFSRWFFTGMAILMLATSIAGFAPAILNPAGRRAPLSLLGAAHGIVFSAWLVLFLVQALLVESRRVAWHRRLGLASAFALPVMIPLGYAVTITMVRRGFDLSGDQGVGRQLDAHRLYFQLRRPAHVSFAGRRRPLGSAALPSINGSCCSPTCTSWGRP